MDPLARTLVAATCGAHLADQLVLATLPLLAVFALGADAAQVGVLVGAHGAGLLLGAAVAPRLLARAPARAVLVGGPASATAAALLLLAAPAPWAGFAAQAMVGVGPMLWQILRTTIVQRATSPELLGRASATIQVAVCGVRPLGAIAQAWGVQAAMVAVAACFAASTAAMAIGRAAAAPATRPEAG